MKQKLVDNILPVFIVLGGVLLRLVPHLPNFTPVSGAALFSGVYLGKRLSLVIPLTAIAISDYLLLYVNPYAYPMIDFSQIRPVSLMFHSMTLYVWGSFAISGLIGLWLKKHKKPSYIIAAALLASTQFFVITNFGVWAGGAYSRGLDGLLESYIMGLPFFRWTLLGDLFYTGVFFGIYELAVWSAKKPNLSIE